MYKKFTLTILVMVSLVASGASYAQSTAKAKSASKPVAKTQEKPAQTEDQKYAQVYEKCTKEAEANEPKYDQLFNSCMEKNGFPQEEYETGGTPMQGIEGQDN